MPAGRAVQTRWPRVRALLVAVLVAGCQPPAVRPIQAPRPDDSLELAAMLPSRVERCVVARPALLSARQRSLALPYSWAEPLAWDSDLPVVAYAAAYVEAPGGRRARRTYVRFGRPERDAIRVLGFRPAGERCEGDACRRPAARWVDERTLEIARYEWAPVAPPGISSEGCLTLARTFPSAVEVAVDTNASLSGLHLPEPARGTRVLFSRSGSLVSRRETVFEDVALARIFELRLRMRGPSIDPVLLPIANARRSFERDAERVIVTESYSWGELELALEDERLRQHARRVTARSSEPIPLDRVQLGDIVVVRRQVQLRRAQLANAAPDERARMLEELAQLLRRAREAHPTELELAHDLAELELRRDPRRSAAIADEVLASDLPEDPERWRVLRRTALALLSSRELASQLGADGLASGADAARAAEDLRALAHGGVDYELAEGAWRTSGELFEGPAPRAAIEARMPIDGLLAALVAWSRLGGVGSHATLQLAVRARASSDVLSIGEGRPELVRVHAPDGRAVYVGALVSPDLASLRRLGAMLAAHTGNGEVEVAIALRAPDGSDARTLRVIGTRAGGTVALARADTDLAGAPWALLTRYVAEPLAEAPVALFPPPTLHVRCESAEVAAELRRGIESTHRGACSTAGPSLRCETQHGLSEIVLRIAELRLATR
jgi:hypothetical protein